MKKIVDMEKWNAFVSKSLEHPINLEGFYKIGLENMVNFATKWLELQPDAEEKHGKWEDDVKVTEYGEWKGIKCSQCGFGIYDVVLFNDFQNFCGHCGAKMDLGEK